MERIETRATQEPRNVKVLPSVSVDRCDDYSWRNLYRRTCSPASGALDVGPRGS